MAESSSARPVRLAGLPAPAVLATGEAVQGAVDLVQQLLFPFQAAQLPLALLFAGGHVDLVAGGLDLPQLVHLVVDARTQVVPLGLQQALEEGLLGIVHVLLVRLAEQVVFAGDEVHGFGKGGLIFKCYNITY